ncbi:hypothetical protein GA0061094_0973 [[Bacillus] enclensis]|uniref:Uncharacterized protein n=1 Tax=[Bacillus] enclensis TaxID=1402860 RepID=A0A1C3ZTL6_9BACI|nr:hypothetical protein GA0061094_0973 [[Bacillus] enclensis]
MNEPTIRESSTSRMFFLFQHAIFLVVQLLFYINFFGIYIVDVKSLQLLIGVQDEDS